MSRIGKMPIELPSGVKVEAKDSMVTVTGPQGTLSRVLLEGIELEFGEGVVLVKRQNDAQRSRSFHGLMRTLISNMVVGVSKGFEKKLEIVGIGYRAELSTKGVLFYLGYSHPIDFGLPVGIKATVEKQNAVSIWGIDNEVVGQLAAKMRALRKPDVYKNKGVKYAGEVLRKKAGKSGK